MDLPGIDGPERHKAAQSRVLFLITNKKMCRAMMFDGEHPLAGICFSLNIDFSSN